MVNAVVLAGTSPDETKLVYGKNKVFLEIGNKPLVSYVIDALKDSNINKSVVVGPRALEEKIQTDGIEFLEESNNNSNIRSFMENLINSYRKAANPDGVLYLACDMPLITKDIINKEIKRFQDTDADLILMLTEERLIPPHLVKIKRNSPLKLDRKRYRWSNMFFVKDMDMDNLLLDLLDIVGKSFSLRRLESLDTKKKLYSFAFKKFKGMASKYILGMLTREDVKRGFYKKFKKKLDILDASSYQSVLDIDYENDFGILKNYILQKNRIKPDYQSQAAQPDKP